MEHGFLRVQPRRLDADGTASALSEHIEQTARLLIAQEQDLLEPA